MNLAANCIGGVKYNIDQELIDYMLRALEKFEPQVAEIRDLLPQQPQCCNAHKGGIGLLPHEDAVSLGVVGPVARASGISDDVRRDSPYSAYPELDFKVIVKNECDIHARTQVRLDEIFESINIIRQCCAKMPEGAHCAQ